MTSNELVVINPETNTPTTTSLMIAEVFGKEHKDILKAIENLECSPAFFGRNFALEGYEVKTGFGTRMAKSYSITRDGFTFLAMGFTGAKAAMFKERYIQAFNEMERRLKAPPMKELSRIELLTMALEAEQKLIEQKPMVQSFTQYMDKGQNISLRTAAKNLGVQPNKLNEMLRQEGTLSSARNYDGDYTNAPMATTANKGYMKTIMPTNSHNGRTAPQTVVTPAGMDWLAKRDRRGDFDHIKSHSNFIYQEAA